MSSLFKDHLAHSKETIIYKICPNIQQRSVSSHIFLLVNKKITLSTAIFCPSLPPIRHGRVSPPSCASPKPKYGVKCEFMCDSGYQLSGTKKTSCVGIGAWSASLKAPRCIGEYQELYRGNWSWISPSLLYYCIWKDVCFLIREYIIHMNYSYSLNKIDIIS